MDAGKVETLVVLGGNPVHTAPADLHFKAAMNKVRFRVHLGAYADETAAQAYWHLPETHPYETWGDARAFDGTVTLQQPLIAPLYEGRSQLEVLAFLVGQAGRTGAELLEEHWLATHGDTGFEAFWKKSLHDGVVGGSAAPGKDLRPRPALLPALPVSPAGAHTEGSELTLRAGPGVCRGRVAQRVPTAMRAVPRERYGSRNLSRRSSDGGPLPIA